MGQQVTLNQAQALQALRAIDQNSDGLANKEELFQAFKRLLTQSGQLIPGQQGGYGQQGYGQGQQGYGSKTREHAWLVPQDAGKCL